MSAAMSVLALPSSVSSKTYELARSGTSVSS